MWPSLVLPTPVGAVVVIVNGNLAFGIVPLPSLSDATLPSKFLLASITSLPSIFRPASSMLKSNFCHFIPLSLF